MYFTGGPTHLVPQEACIKSMQTNAQTFTCFLSLSLSLTHTHHICMDLHLRQVAIILLFIPIDL